MKHKFRSSAPASFPSFIVYRVVVVWGFWSSLRGLLHGASRLFGDLFLSLAPVAFMRAIWGMVVFRSFFFPFHYFVCCGSFYCFHLLLRK